jgi:hypothetical protein
MKCEECLPLVEEYADGELDGQTNDLVARHLDDCASCASAYRKTLREQELYLRYECDAQAAPTFWENVMARAVASENNRAQTQTPARGFASLHGWLRGLLGNFSAPRFSPSLTALMVLLAVGVTAIVMSYLNPKEKSSLQAGVSQEVGAPLASATSSAALPASSTNTNSDNAISGKGSETQVNDKPRIARNDSGVVNRHPLAAKKETTARSLRSRLLAEGQLESPDALIREAEQKYVAAINLLSRDLNRRRSRLDAETAARFERTLVAVDRTIADTRRAARKHPDDPVAAKYVLTAYAKKVDVLREMIGH